MVYADERQIIACGEPFGVIDAHQQSGNESGSVSRGNRINLIQRIYASVFECLSHDQIHGLKVFTRGKFRNNPAIRRVLADLRSHYIAENSVAILYYRCLLYTSDAADEEESLDFCRGRIDSQKSTRPKTQR
eukprot:TRINITY_DN15891_c0_g1_i2.p1 TRINITY_DN15891_c0_g1~~TRINITY_DN15891_c0_g1_i2.p1  ORF type:complete len:132 (+),score=9.90 TRINITY_DN15891_c0_g1_i2:156-551(+)